MNDLPTRVGEELQDRLDRLPIPPAPVDLVQGAAARQRRRVTAAVVAGAVVVLLTVGTGGWVWQAHRHQESFTTRILDDLGCTSFSKVAVEGPGGPEGTRTTIGPTSRICTHDGGTIIVWTLAKGGNVIHPPGWVRNVVMDLPDHVYVGCSDPDVCAGIQRRYGGKLSSADDLLGISITVG